jgi:hypothetical protein
LRYKLPIYRVEIICNKSHFLPHTSEWESLQPLEGTGTS